jgi:uncharacterized HAD superfamily protein
MSLKDKEEMTKTFCLSLHAEVSQLIDSVHYKQHLERSQAPNRDKILFEAVDSFRYIIAILNLWDVTPEEFGKAFFSKDVFLNKREELNTKKRRKNQPVIICDVDDVIAEFRITYAKYVKSEFNVSIDPQSTEYYNINPIASAGLDPENVFVSFVSSGGFANLPVCNGMISVLQEFQKRGYWIQLLTARPKDNARCVYDTYSWLVKHSIPFDSIDFSTEKYIWISDKDYYNTNLLICALDDSLKHASEYAQHGVPVIIPEKSYNSIIPKALRKKMIRVKHNNIKILEAVDNIISNQKKG